MHGPPVAHHHTDGDKGPEGRDDDQGDAQRFPESQELDDLGDAEVTDLVGPVVLATLDTFTGICPQSRTAWVSQVNLAVCCIECLGLTVNMAPFCVYKRFWEGKLC